MPPRCTLFQRISDEQDLQAHNERIVWLRVMDSNTEISGEQEEAMRDAAERV
jgi:hypothetical protein